MDSGTRKNVSQENQEDIKHALENLLDCDLEDEEDISFIKFFQELASIGGIYAIIILSV